MKQFVIERIFPHAGRFRPKITGIPSVLRPGQPSWASLTVDPILCTDESHASYRRSEEMVREQADWPGSPSSHFRSKGHHASEYNLFG